MGYDYAMSVAAHSTDLLEYVQRLEPAAERHLRLVIDSDPELPSLNRNVVDYDRHRLESEMILSSTDTLLTLSDIWVDEDALKLALAND